MKFKANEDVIGALRTWLREQDKAWDQQDTHTYPCWRKAVEVGGEFLER
jgi:hypothetical protein